MALHSPSCSRDAAAAAAPARAGLAGAASRAAPAADDGRPYIYIACPWTPVGGGMFKVADYLIQAQSREEGAHDRPGARLRPLDTRGPHSPLRSLGVLTCALARLAQGRWSGRLAGVHVNMAERLSLLRKSVVVVACRALGVPVVLHLHAAQLHRAWPRLPAPARALLRWVFSLPRCCIVLGSESARFVTGELKVPWQRVEVVINGVPEPAQVARPGTVGAPVRLLFVGNLSDRKGVPELLQAMARPALAHQPVELTLAGGGDAAGYRLAADRLGLGRRVRFEGWAEQARVAQLMAQSDLLVLPSHDEGLPLVILEALAGGLPVVCTPVGEIGQTLHDGVHARFVAPGDPAGLARALADLLADPQARAMLARNGKSLYRQHFTLATFFDRIAAIHARHFGIAGHRRPEPREIAP